MAQGVPCRRRPARTEGRPRAARSLRHAGRTTCRAALAASLLLSAPAGLWGQLPEIRGYILNVGLWSESTPITRGGLADLLRGRLMSTPVLGPVSLGVAYEQVVIYTERAGSGLFGGAFADVVPSGGEWLDLQWTIDEGRHASWRHRFDRLAARLAIGDRVELSAGRQTISWATTLILTPADPFAPFDPADPFREFRAGVDAVRARYFAGPFTEMEAVVRPSETPLGTTLTALGRARGLIAGWEISGWAGLLHDEPAVGAGGAGSLGSVAIRAEASVRDPGDRSTVRLAVGADTRLALFGRDLYLVAEYQRDGFGAEDAGRLIEVFRSEPFARGELQVLGRNSIAATASYQVDPLIGGSLIALWNLNDGSALLGPALSYSISNEATARLGVYAGAGNSRVGPGSIGSEYGSTPALVYGSLSLFF